MSRRRVSLVALLIVATVSYGQALTPSQDPMRVTATAELIPGRPAVRVTVTNRAEVPLEAWEYRVSYLGPSGEAQSFITTYDTYPAIGLQLVTPLKEIGPIAANESRAVTETLGGIPTSVSVEMVAAVFGDLSTAGAAVRLLNRREEKARELERWISLLKPILNGRANVRGRLQRAWSDEIARERGAGEAQGSRTTREVQELLRNTRNDDELAHGLTEMVSSWERRRELALRHKRGR